MHSSFLRPAVLGVSLGLLAAPGAGAVPNSFLGAPLHLRAPLPIFESVDEGRHVVPRVRGFGFTSRPGEPMVPLQVVLVAIPEGAEPELEILSARSTSLGKLSLAPVPHLR